MESINLIKWVLHCDNKQYNILEMREKPIEVHEQCQCYFEIELSDNEKPALLLGDFTVRLKLVSQKDGVYLYQSDKNKCFQNFLGLTHAEIIFDDDLKHFVSSAISVFARKATYERALSFLKILNEKSDISSICFSVTKMNSDANKGVNNLVAMLKAGAMVLQYFQEHQSYFARYPCAKTKITRKVQPYNHSVNLDDKAVAYICHNPDSLTMSHYSESDVNVGGRPYNISQIETTVPVKDTDVFENQVILGFLNTFLTYLKQVRDKLAENKLSNNERLFFDGTHYLSIDRLLYDSGLLEEFHRDRVDKSIANCASCIAYLNKLVPCQIPQGKDLSPLATQKVLARPHYVGIFTHIKHFYDVGEPQWRGHLEFFGLRNMYKIYEFVVLVGLLESIESSGYTMTSADYVNGKDNSSAIRPINEPCNRYFFSKDQLTLELLYEPKSLRFVDINANTSVGSIIDVTHLQSARTWTPDFAIVTRDGDACKTHILDAKYSDIDSIRKFHLPECVLKYTTKLYKLSHQRTIEKVDSMHLLFSGDHHSSYESFYAPALSLYDKNGSVNLSALNPMIGMLSYNEHSLSFLPCFVDDILTM